MAVDIRDLKRLSSFLLQCTTSPANANKSHLIIPVIGTRSKRFGYMLINRHSSAESKLLALCLRSPYSPIPTQHGAVYLKNDEAKGARGVEAGGVEGNIEVGVGAV